MNVITKDYCDEQKQHVIGIFGKEIDSSIRISTILFNNKINFANLKNVFNKLNTITFPSFHQ